MKFITHPVIGVTKTFQNIGRHTPPGNVSSSVVFARIKSDSQYPSTQKFNAAKRHFPEFLGWETGTIACANTYVGTTRLRSTAKPLLDVAGDVSARHCRRKRHVWRVHMLHGFHIATSVDTWQEYGTARSGVNMSVFQAQKQIQW